LKIQGKKRMRIDNLENPFLQTGKSYFQGTNENETTSLCGGVFAQYVQKVKYNP
jgi:hypothetical protein